MNRFPQPRHLLLYVAAVRGGSLSAAARAVHVTQPAVTQTVAALERRFGTPLLERGARGIAPTSAGMAVLARAERALGYLRAAIGGGAESRSVRADAALRGITAAQLESLVAVVETNSFTRAARSRGVARSTLHRAASEFERRAGQQLFESTSHGVQPTREAVRLARAVQLAFAEMEQARAETAADIDMAPGRTVVGAMPLARSFVVPAAVLSFADRFPSHEVEILDGPYGTLLDALRRGRADVLVGALRDDAPDDVTQEPLFDDPLAIIVRTGHPLTAATRGGRRTPSRELLATLAWIAPRRDSPLRQHYERLLASVAARPPAAAVECNSLVAARALLVASDRAMLLSSQQVRHEISTGELVALPHPAGRVVRAIGLTCRREWRPTAAQAAFVETLRRVSPRPAARSRPPREMRAATRPFGG